MALEHLPQNLGISKRIRLSCSGCGRKLSFDRVDAGKPAICPACGKRLRIPAAAPVAARVMSALPGETAGTQTPVAESVAASDAGPGAKPASVVEPVRRGWARWKAIAGMAAVGVVCLAVGWWWGHAQNRTGVLVVERSAERPAAVQPSRAEGVLATEPVGIVPVDVPRQPVKVPPRAPRVTEESPARVDVSPMAADEGAKPVLPATRAAPVVANVEPYSPILNSKPLEDRTASEYSLNGARPKRVVAVLRGIDGVPLRIHRPAPPHAEGITDEQIGDAIKRGVDYLLGQLGKDTKPDSNSPDAMLGPHRLQGQWAGMSDQSYHDGSDALSIYALLQAGQAIKDDRLLLHGNTPLAQQVDRLKKMEFKGTLATYCYGIRATALALADRKEDKAVMQGDLHWLLTATRDGSYTYGVQPHRQMYDNSNSQYGVLGVWSLAEAGWEVPTDYWRKVEQHWLKDEQDDGQWGYIGQSSRPRLSMTLAGVATLLVTHDYLQAPEISGVGQQPFPPGLTAGLAWLEEKDHAIDLSDEVNYYYSLYGVERVGLASGFKYFGANDWYRKLAAEVVDLQEADGSWGNDSSTAYALLFLARGRHPILMNKLRFTGSWANRPRDVANLARFTQHTLERQLNWQIVSIDRDWTDWTDSPILYLASHQAIKLTDAQVDKIRQYVLAGGLLYTQSDGNSLAFNKFAEELAHRLFPDLEMHDIAAEPGIAHELSSMVYPLKTLPPLRVVSNGTRLLMVHNPKDYALYWNQRADKSHAEAFQFGTNLYVYATGKSDLRNRIDSTVVPPPAETPEHSLKVARVRYGGNWDPEPAAFARFGRWFWWQTGLGLQTPTINLVDLGEQSPSQVPIAHITGNVAYTPTDAEVAAIRQYVSAGGVLVAEPCGGDPKFGQSIDDMLLRAFGVLRERLVEDENPILSGSLPGMSNLAKPVLRPFAHLKFDKTSQSLRILSIGRGHVIVAPLDISSGLLGSNTWGILGFDPDYAQALWKNMILWTAYGQQQ